MQPEYAVQPVSTDLDEESNGLTSIKKTMVIRQSKIHHLSRA